MGKRIPLTKLPGRFVLAVGRVVELADEAAFVRFMLACRHQGQLVPAMYDPAALDGEHYTRVMVCPACSSIFLAGGWAFRGPPECFPNGRAGGGSP
jgi:hypothetical protein